MAAGSPPVIVLRWTEVHEWRTVAASAEGADVARAAERAVNESGIFQRIGVNLPSVSFQAEDA